MLGPICLLQYIDYVVWWFRDAARVSLRRHISDAISDEICNIPYEEIIRPLSVASFEQAMKNIRRTVSVMEHQKYERWMAEYGSSICTRNGWQKIVCRKSCNVQYMSCDVCGMQPG